LVEGASRQKTPNEIALTILLAVLTIIFLLAVVAVAPMSTYAGVNQSLIVLTALLVCLIPTTIGALLSAIGIAGMDRLVQRNVLATSGRAVEAAGDIDTLLLDKTGTITFGNRQATELVPISGVDSAELAAVARLSSLADQTPEGRSIVALCAREYGLPGEATADEAVMEFVAFTAQTRMSGVDLNGRSVRKGAASAVAHWSGSDLPEVDALVAEISDAGGTPLVVAEASSPEGGAGSRVLGVIRLSDVVKPGMRARFDELRAMGIRTVMITGDNPR
ncbi:HAD family hydrolase, partial [Pseudonocardia yunnanensis]